MMVEDEEGVTLLKSRPIKEQLDYHRLRFPS